MVLFGSTPTVSTAMEGLTMTTRPAYPIGKIGTCSGPRAKGSPALAEEKKREKKVKDVKKEKRKKGQKRRKKG